MAAIEWDDFRYFLIAARSGSYIAASERLNASATTVGRRVQRLETALKTTLFLRSASGLQLTPAGLLLSQAGGQIEGAVDAAQHLMDRSSGGIVRISSPEGFGTLLLAPSIYRVVKANPTLSVELIAWAGAPSITRREVDMSIGFAPSDAARLRNEHLTDFEVGLYGTEAFVTTWGRPETVDDLRHMPLAGFVHDMLYAQELRYMDDLAPDLRPTLTSTSSRAHMEFIGSGACVGMLPCFMADRDPRLVRLMPDVARSRRAFWLATHEEIFGTSRWLAIRKWLIEIIAESHPTLMPTLPPEPAPYPR